MIQAPGAILSAVFFMCDRGPKEARVPVPGRPSFHNKLFVVKAMSSPLIGAPERQFNEVYSGITRKH